MTDFTVRLQPDMAGKLVLVGMQRGRNSRFPLLQSLPSRIPSGMAMGGSRKAHEKHDGLHRPFAARFGWETSTVVGMQRVRNSRFPLLQSRPYRISSGMAMGVLKQLIKIMMDFTVRLQP
jgi:hypothetical protein